MEAINKKIFLKHPQWRKLFIKFTEIDPNINLNNIEDSFNKYLKYKQALNKVVNIQDIEKAISEP